MWELLVRFILRYRLAIIISIFSVTLFMAWSATRVQMSYELAQMLPETDPVFIQYNEFRETFGEDGNVVFLGIQDERYFLLENFNNWQNIMDSLLKIEGVTEVIGISNIPQIIRDDQARKFDFKPVFTGRPESQAELDSLIQKVFELKFYENLLFKKIHEI